MATVTTLPDARLRQQVRGILEDAADELRENPAPYTHSGGAVSALGLHSLVSAVTDSARLRERAYRAMRKSLAGAGAPGSLSDWLSRASVAQVVGLLRSAKSEVA